jgi:hypothetical protein
VGSRREEISDRTREQHAAEALRKRAREYTDMARALDQKWLIEKAL